MITKSDLILPEDWIMALNNTEDVNIDLEYYTLKLKSYEAKTNKFLESKNYTHFLEHIYHTMNLNSFIVDGKIYDTTFKLINTENYKPYINNIKIRKEDSNILKAIRIAQNIFKFILIGYLDKMPKENIIIFNNNTIHTLNDINILVKENDSNYYQLWNMLIGNDYQFMNKIFLIDRIEITENNNIEGILKNSKSDIHKNNMIGIEMNNTTSVEESVLGLRDVMVLNRIFKTSERFTASLYIELSNYIKSTGKFDYRFKVN